MDVEILSSCSRTIREWGGKLVILLFKEYDSQVNLGIEEAAFITQCEPSLSEQRGLFERSDQVEVYFVNSQFTLKFIQIQNLSSDSHLLYIRL